MHKVSRWAFLCVVALVACKKKHVDPGGGSEARLDQGRLGIQLAFRTTENSRMGLSGFPLIVQRESDGSTVLEGSSDVRGRWVTSPLKVDRYRICTQDSGQCAAPMAAQKDATTEAPLLEVALPGALFGTLKLRSGEPCRVVALDFGVDVVGRLEFLDASSSVIKTVQSNDLGQFVGLPPAGAVRARATCEKAASEAELPTGGGRLDFTFENNRPRILSIDFESAGAARTPKAGETVTFRAEVEDEVPSDLVYRWRWLNAVGEATRTAPAESGTYPVRVLVSDGQGGYDVQSLKFEVGESLAYFGGTVVDAVSLQPVPNAQVTVTDEVQDVGKTNATVDGKFWLSEMPTPSAYLLRAEAKGYAPAVLEVQGATPMATIRLKPVVSTTFSTGLSALVERPGQGNSATLGIPNGALTVSSGAGVPDGEVTVELERFALGNEPLPGRGLGRQKSGDIVPLEFIAGVHLRAYASGGAALSFEGSAPAQLSLEVPERGNLPSSAPTWSFDAVSGLWIENDDVAQLRDNGVLHYELTPRKALSLVIGIPISSLLTCVRVAIDASLNGSHTLRAQYSAFFQSHVVDQPIGTAAFYPFLRVPKSGSVTLKVLDSQGHEIQPSTQVLNLATRPALAGENSKTLPFPYSPCGTPVVMSLQAPDAGSPPPFLSGNVGFGPPPAGGGFDLLTEQYYAAVDPLELRTTLKDWWLANGFTSKGFHPTAVRTSYHNLNDLGFGRDMNCLQSVGGLACYVTNYGQADNSPGVDNALLAQNRAGPGATVTMEYSQIEGGPSTKVVKFFAYGASSPNGRINAVDLDGNGDKPIPQLCATCHGGRYEPVDPFNPTFDEVSAPNYLHSSFREFDLDTFRYPGLRDFTQLTLARKICPISSSTSLC